MGAVGVVDTTKLSRVIFSDANWVLRGTFRFSCDMPETYLNVEGDDNCCAHGEGHSPSTFR